MRIRRKPWRARELAACPFCIDDPENHIGHWHELFPKRRQAAPGAGLRQGLVYGTEGAANPQINFLAVDIKSDILGLSKRNIEKAYEQAGKEVDNVRIFALRHRTHPAGAGQKRRGRAHLHQFLQPLAQEKA